MAAGAQVQRSAAILERLCIAYLDLLPIPRVETDSDLGRLSPAEKAFLRAVSRRTAIAAFIISVVCTAGLFVPAYMGVYPMMRVALFGGSFTCEWAFWGAMFVWLLIEIILLILLNLLSVHQVAAGTGFLTVENKQEIQPQVVRIALATPARDLARFGLDPYQDANPIGLFIYNVLQMTKGFLAHQLTKLVLIGIGGRAALRSILDFSGVPIYGAINAFAANHILSEAEIIIMGRKSIEQLGSRLPRFPPDSVFQDSVYDALQFVAMSKRDFHPNHAALADTVLAHYLIKPRDSHRFSLESVRRFRSLPTQQRRVVSLVLVAGLVLDGRITRREKKRLEHLGSAALIGASIRQISQWAASFRNGEGVGDLLQHECFAIR